MWFDRMNGQPVGLCRVVPPTVIPSDLDEPDHHGRLTKPFTTWPIVREDDWCAKYERSDDVPWKVQPRHSRDQS